MESRSIVAVKSGLNQNSHRLQPEITLMQKIILITIETMIGIGSLSVVMYILHK